MKNKLYRLSLLIVLMSLGLAAWADTVNINITGRFNAMPCVVDVSTQEVSFGKIKKQDLSVAGSYSSTIRDFSISLSNCPPSTTVATATFIGGAYADDSSAFANNGTAQNVGIKVIPAGSNWSDTSVQNLSTMSKAISPDLHTASFDFSARLYSATGNVTSGTIDGVMMVTFSYD
ncbi:fimbrial protein [Budvicia diplopodorum]|uniref:fimbrial protein n=1 Tax=Budvicia diplopodorum TaxID=1119056 RepID=UPI00135C07F6|nr:fimbrial protein [Budvicia diplopodorum]